MRNPRAIVLASMVKTPPVPGPACIRLITLVLCLASIGAVAVATHRVGEFLAFYAEVSRI